MVLAPDAPATASGEKLHLSQWFCNSGARLSVCSPLSLSAADAIDSVSWELCGANVKHDPASWSSAQDSSEESKPR